MATAGGRDCMTQKEVDAYLQHGWALVPIPAGSKGPRTNGWNLEKNTLDVGEILPPGYGVGLAHAYSGTAALDIDDMTMAEAKLREWGIELSQLFDAPDSVAIRSGREGHGKLLFAMPDGLVLPWKRLVGFAPDGSPLTYLEFRCGTANGLTCQDILPPTLNPNTKQPYTWAGNGHWTRLPLIPPALLEGWQSLMDQSKQRTLSTGDSFENFTTSWLEIEQALYTIPPDLPRTEWIKVGMALRYAAAQDGIDEQGFTLWNDWSATSTTKYGGEEATLYEWKSFKNDRASSTKLGSLFYVARKYGWKQKDDHIELFSPVNPDVDNAPLAPVEITQMLRPSPPDVRLDLWPPLLAARATEVSNGVGCDPVIPLFAGLGAICAVIDARSRLELLPGFEVPPILWLMTIGYPADKKSPGSKPMLSVLRSIEAEDSARFKRDLLTWEGKEAAYAKAKKAYLEFCASPEAMLGVEPPIVPDQPPQPVPLRFTVGDITSQKLVRWVGDRPSGVLCYLDEMKSWVEKMADKTSGEDRSAWVVSYEASRHEMDRVGAGSICADNMAISFYGNIQPTVLKSVLPNLAADGLIQRFIPAIIRSESTRRGEPLPDILTSSELWENKIRSIYALKHQKYGLSKEATAYFRDFQLWYEDRKRDERLLMANETYMTAFGKIEGTIGRLALIFHIVESPYEQQVSLSVIQRVITIVKSYLIPAYKYVYGEFGNLDSFDQWLADYILQYADKETITLSELKRAGRRRLEGRSIWAMDQTVINGMIGLESANWVRRISNEAEEKRHVVEWMINPLLKEKFASHRRKVIEAKQRLHDEMQKGFKKESSPVHGNSR